MVRETGSAGALKYAILPFYAACLAGIFVPDRAAARVDEMTGVSLDTEAVAGWSLASLLVILAVHLFEFIVKFAFFQRLGGSMSRHFRKT